MVGIRQDKFPHFDLDAVRGKLIQQVRGERGSQRFNKFIGPFLNEFSGGAAQLRIVNRFGEVILQLFKSGERPNRHVHVNPLRVSAFFVGNSDPGVNLQLFNPNAVAGGTFHV